MAAVSCLAASCGSGATSGSIDSVPDRPHGQEQELPTGPVIEVLDVATDPRFVIGDRDGGYRVLYRLVDLKRADSEPVWEELVVDPPFDGLVETSTGPAPGGPVTSRIATTFDRRSTGAEDPLVSHREPTLADAHLELAAVLDDAIAAGRIELRGQRTVQGRRCAVVRSSRPLRAGPLLAIGADRYTESCVDGEGILLEEIQFEEGVALLERVAVEVEIGDAPLTSITMGEVIVPADRGGGAVLPVEIDSEPVGEFWVVPEGSIPEGFLHTGRFSVIPAQPDRFSGEPDAGSPIAAVADVYRRGSDVIVVYQGATLRGDAAWPVLPDVIDVTAGDLGTAQLVLDARGSEVRSSGPGGRFVHVLGSRPPAELIEVASVLRRVEGTGLVYR